MSHYLKKILFTLLIIIMPYMNAASKAMDDGDYEGSSVRVSKVSFVTEDQQDVSSSVKPSTSYQVVSSEDSQTSFSSYLVSSVKAPFQMANEFIDIAIQNPRKGLFIGLVLAYQVVAVAADCNCVCYDVGNKNNKQFIGRFSDFNMCFRACSQLVGNWNIDACNPT